MSLQSCCSLLWEGFRSEHDLGDASLISLHSVRSYQPPIYGMVHCRSVAYCRIWGSSHYGYADTSE